MINSISERFLLVVNRLVKENKVKSIRKFCLSLDYLPQSLSAVQKGNRDIPVSVLQKAVSVYKVNPLFLFNGEGEMFLDENHQFAFRTLTLVTNQYNDERIVHVPMPAQAGYAYDLNSLEMMRDLPTYTLPDISYQTGTFRSFDVKGDSMDPGIEDGDKLICSFLEPSHWESSIRDHHVYVVVTRGDVVVKRVINNLRKHNHLEMHSDNEVYSMYRMQGNEIQEVWYVRAKISDFKHHASIPVAGASPEDIQALHQTIKAQATIIEQLQQKAL